MKAKDLMIGDWVISTLNKAAYQIDPILAYGIIDAVLKNDPDIDNHFEPIPLTLEILEKNGFKHYATYPNEDIWMNMLFDPEIEVVFTEEKTASIRIFNYSEEDDGKEIINLEDNGKSRYVHELQHALRLCGLNDLADNFQI